MDGTKTLIFVQFLPHDLNILGLSERDFYGWHLRLAFALYRYGRIPSIILRLKKSSEPSYVVGVSYVKLSKRLGLSFGYLGVDLCSTVRDILKKLLNRHEVVVYVHEWKALNSLRLISCLCNLKGVHIVAQQHHLPPFPYRSLRKKSSMSRYIYRLLFEYEHNVLFGCNNLKIIYVLNDVERRLYSELYPDKIVRINTMGVDFPEAKVRRELEEKEITYVGPITFNSHRGGDLLIKYFLKHRKDNIFKLKLMGPADERLCSFASSKGIRCLGKVHNSIVKRELQKSSLFIWLASKETYWGGLGVSPMEALSFNVPVASPTLIHHMGDKDRLGWVLPWREAGEEKVFSCVDNILDELMEGKQKEPYEEGKKHYDWRVIIDRIISDIKSIS